MTFEVDVTNFKNKIKEKNFSFTLSIVYAVCKVANEIENFRYRFLDEKIILFDKIDTSFTWLDNSTELFKVVNVPLIDSLESYVELAKKIIAAQKNFFTAPPGEDVFICSPMPFITYKHVSHTISGKKNFATPLFDWGKFYSVGEKFLMPISVQVHHSFADGVHVGKFADKLQNFLDDL